MAKKIKTFKFNGVVKQTGFGKPNHMALKGSKFTDLTNTNIYINENGLNTWKLINFTGGTSGGKFITGSTFSNNEVTLTRNDSVDVFKLSGGTNVTLSNPSLNQIKIDVPSSATLTGGTFDNNKNLLTLEKDDGTNINITGDTLYFETEMYFSVEQTGIGIKFSESNGYILKVYNVNTIEAIQNNSGIKIQLNGGRKIIINELNLSTTYINNNLVTQVLSTALTELNSFFQNTGSIGGTPPTITSPSTIYLTLGNSINYILTGTNAVAYSWENLPNGVVTVEGNTRNIIGGSGLSAGLYVITGRITNYYGEDTISINIVVSPVFVNTYSITGQWQVHYTNSVSGQENNTPLYRPTMTGTASDAWSMMCWFKWRTFNSNPQNLFHFGSPNSSTDGKIYAQVNIVSNNIEIIFYYGTNTNYLQQVATTSVSYLNWHCLLITYTGGDTGNNSSDILNYQNQFKIFLDGNQVSTTNSNGNYGYTGSIDGTTNSSAPLRLLRKGFYSSFAPYLYVDEMSFWASDVSSDASTLYNSGTPLDLTTLYTPLYSDYYRFGDGTDDITNYPVMTNLGSGPDLTMVSGSVAKYINDVP
jgi:hypothetical protein